MTNPLVKVRSKTPVVTMSPRARILKAVRELFYKHGIHTVGVELIAGTAGTNKMTLYRHFSSKDELILEYVRELAAEGDAVWEGISRAHPGDPNKRLEAWTGHVEAVLSNQYSRGCALANAAVELQAGHPARAVIEAYKMRKRDRLVRLFTKAELHDPERLADEVFLLLEGARISMQCGGAGPASRVAGLLRDLLSRSRRRPRR